MTREAGVTVGGRGVTRGVRSRARKRVRRWVTRGVRRKGNRLMKKGVPGARMCPNSTPLSRRGNLCVASREMAARGLGG